MLLEHGAGNGLPASVTFLSGMAGKGWADVKDILQKPKN